VFAASTDNNIYALDANNGNLSWFFSCNAAVHSSPVVYGEYVFFGCDDGRLYAINTTTGLSEWFFAPEYTIGNDVYNFVTTPFISDPVVDDSVLYVGLNGTIYALAAQTVESQEDDSDDGSEDQDDNQEGDDESGDEESDNQKDDDSESESSIIPIIFIMLTVVLTIIMLSLYWIKKQNL